MVLLSIIDLNPPRDSPAVFLADMHHLWWLGNMGASDYPQGLRLPLCEWYPTEAGVIASEHQAVSSICFMIAKSILEGERHERLKFVLGGKVGQADVV